MTETPRPFQHGDTAVPELDLSADLHRDDVARSPALCTVNIYPRGTITDRGRPVSRLRPGPGGPRSTITGFSRASAARLRRLLASVDGPQDWLCFGATLTIPGPPVSIDDWHRIWNAFRSRIDRISLLTLIWRIELQQRGQPHIHCICWAETQRVRNRLRDCWMKSLDTLGPAEGSMNRQALHKWCYGHCHGVEREEGTIHVDHRSAWPQAWERAVRIDELEENNEVGWWRYLAAHASKSKQAQLGWHGGQWGIIRRGLLVSCPALAVRLPRRAMNRFIRCCRRLIRCRFSSGHGRQTWFISPRASFRLSEWALAQG